MQREGTVCWNRRQEKHEGRVLAQVGQAGCAALASLPRLRCLELSYCDSLSDTPVCELTRLRHLSELSLAGCASVTDIAVTALVRGMPELMRLDLSACHMHVGDISLYAIATLPNLQVGPISIVFVFLWPSVRSSASTMGKKSSAYKAMRSKRQICVGQLVSTKTQSE